MRITAVNLKFPNPYYSQSCNDLLGNRKYNYGFRDYSPVSMRFSTVDPVKDGSNWYSYVNNDPINFIDPFGLSPSDHNFGHPDEAAKDWAETYGQKSFDDGLEYGSSIYQNNDGSYSYSDPNIGSPVSVEPSKPDDPSLRVSGEIHTHPTYDKNGYIALPDSDGDGKDDIVLDTNLLNDGPSAWDMNKVNSFNEILDADREVYVLSYKGDLYAYSDPKEDPRSVGSGYGTVADYQETLDTFTFVEY